MNLELTARSLNYQVCLKSFMDECIYPLNRCRRRR